ncbi:MAG: DoxX family membrane protein [Vicinamibacterales bacterium]
MNKQGTGLVIIRVCLGVFFLFEGLSKLGWFADAGVLSGRLAGWLADAQVGSASRWYLEHVAMRGTAIFARVVPLAELATGVALIAGAWTRTAALLAFLMVLNFHVASGALFKYAFLTNGYGLPVLAATLGLAVGGVRLPLSLRR